jgi:hypothetical protein
MKYLVYIIIVLVILSLYLNFIKIKETFTEYELDYGTGIGPWWAQGAGLNRGFHRCNCSGTGDCRCINGNQPINSIYPQYYFN